MFAVKDEFSICDGLFILTNCIDEENKRKSCPISELMSVVKQEFSICDDLFILTSCIDEEHKRRS